MIQYYTKIDRNIIALESQDQASWINISAPFNSEELQKLADHYQLPLDFLTDSLDVDERSRYEREDDARLIVVNTPIVNNSGNESEAMYFTAPIGIILVEEVIITISAFDNPIINKFLENRVKYFDPLDREMFVLLIFEQTVFRFLECLKKLNLKRNLIEQELYNSSRNRELTQLLKIEKSLVYFVNSLSSNELLKLKIKRTDYLNIQSSPDHLDLFEDIIIDNSQALEMSNVYANILSGTMETYASIISNNMNVFIHRLTIITIILMVPTVIASFFGMNVNLPFRDSQMAFYFIIVFSVLLGFFLIWFIRRKNFF